MGIAAELAQKELWDNNTHLSKIRAHFEHQILDLEGLKINGSIKNRLYNTSNISFPLGFNKIPLLLKEFAFSSGSACVSGNNEPSHVLNAMGLNNAEIKNSYRFSFSKYNTQKEIEKLIQSIMA